MEVSVLGIDLGKNSCSVVGWTAPVGLSFAGVCDVRRSSPLQGHSRHALWRWRPVAVPTIWAVRW